MTNRKRRFAAPLSAAAMLMTAALLAAPLAPAAAQTSPGSSSMYAYVRVIG